MLFYELTLEKKRYFKASSIINAIRAAGICKLFVKTPSFKNIFFNLTMWCMIGVFGKYEKCLGGNFKRATWTLKGSLTNANSYLQLSNYDPTFPASSDVTKTLNLQPNPPTSIGGAIQYKSFGFSIEPQMVRNEESLLQKGYSEQKKYAFSYANHNWVLETFYYKSRGFYTDSPRVIDPNWSEQQPFPQFPRMGVLGSGTSFLYALDSKDFSAEAMVNQSEYFSGGFSDSILLGMNLGKTVFSDLPAVTVFFDSGSSMALDLKRLETYSISPQVGYGMFLGFFDMYVSLSSLIGPSFERSRFAQSDFKYQTGLNLRTMIGLGYHSSDSFMVFSGKTDTITNAQDIFVSRSRLHIEIASGMHFK